MKNILENYFWIGLRDLVHENKDLAEKIAQEKIDTNQD